MKTFWRLLGFLRPYRAGVIASFLLAAAAMGVGVLIPYLVGPHGRRHPRRRRRTCGRSRSPSSAPGVLRLVFSVAAPARGRAGLARRRVRPAQPHVRAPQSLELAFFDSQQTGQLMSRATVDLQAVRFFLGYGLIFIAPVGAHDRDRRGGDVRARPRAGGGRRSPRCRFVIWIAFRYGRLQPPGHRRRCSSGSPS